MGKNKNTSRECFVQECDRDYYCKNLCRRHYNKLLYYGDPLGQPLKPPQKKCSLEDCNSDFFAKGFCSVHYWRNYKHGHPNPTRGVRGEGTVDFYGYVRVTIDGRSYRKHRLVMEKYLGRQLLDWETVHHIDGDKLNNNINNLQLRTSHHGPGVIMECQNCGSNNILPVKLTEDGDFTLGLTAEGIEAEKEIRNQNNQEEGKNGTD